MKEFVGNVLMINPKKRVLYIVLNMIINFSGGHAQRSPSKRLRIALLIMMMGSVCTSMAAKTVCHPLLWPAESPVMNPAAIVPLDTMEERI